MLQGARNRLAYLRGEIASGIIWEAVILAALICKLRLKKEIFTFNYARCDRSRHCSPDSFFDIVLTLIRRIESAEAGGNRLQRQRLSTVLLPSGIYIIRGTATLRKSVVLAVRIRASIVRLRLVGNKIGSKRKSAAKAPRRAALISLGLTRRCSESRRSRLPLGLVRASARNLDQGIASQICRTWATKSARRLSREPLQKPSASDRAIIRGGVDWRA